MFRAERLWVSCTNFTSSPAAANFRSSQDSKKYPRGSPNTFGRMRTTSGISVGSNCISNHLAASDLEQISPVTGLSERQRQLFQARGVYVAGAEGDLLRTTHFQSLPTLDRLDEHRRLEQRFVGAGIQPRNTTTQDLDPQRAAL